MTQGVRVKLSLSVPLQTNLLHRFTDDPVLPSSVAKGCLLHTEGAQALIDFVYLFS